MDIKGVIEDFIKNKTQLMLAIALVSIIALFLFINFLLLPQVMKVADIFGKIGKTNSELKMSVGEIAAIPGLKKKIDMFKGKVDSYEKMLPIEREIPSLLENLSSMAKRSRVKIVGIMPIADQASKQDTVKKDRIYQEIPILISAKSGYHELGMFLSDLESSDRFMKVVDISIKASKNTPSKHDIEMIVCTYILLKGNK